MNERDITVVSLGMVNAYLLKAGDGFVLIDTGIPWQYSRLEKLLTSSGCHPGKLRLVIATHGDYDHIGNCAQLQEKFKTRIAMYKSDWQMAQTGTQDKRTPQNPLMQFMKALMAFTDKLNIDIRRFQKFLPDVYLYDGQSLEEFGLAARVIHSPGHTKGSIVVLTSDGALFAGDSLSNNFKPGLAPLIEDFKEYAESLDKIKSLKAVTVYPGHGKPFSTERLSQLTFQQQK